MTRIRIVVTGLILFSAFSLAAQNSAVTNAYLYWESEDLVKAREFIDKAAEHDKSGGKAKTWFYRGGIYQSIAASEEDRNLVDNPVITAYESYQKAMELDEKKKQYYEKSKEQLPLLYPGFVNTGYKFYQNKQYEDALESFRYAQKVNPEDTVGFLFAAYAADALGKQDEVKRNVRALKELGMSNAFTVQKELNYLREEEKYEEAAALAQESSKRFPKHETAFNEALANIYIVQQDYRNALEVLNRLIAVNSNNVQYLENAAQMHDKLGNDEKALETYRRVQELAPGNFVSAYNGALIAFNKAAKLYNDGKHEEAEEYFATAETYARRALESSEKQADKESMQEILEESKAKR